MIDLLLLSAAGFVVGVLVALSGIGGASLTTPLLILLGMEPRIAVGSDLLFNTVNKSLGSALYLKRGDVDLKILKNLLIGSLAGLAVSSALIEYFRRVSLLNEITAAAVGVVLIGVSLLHIYRFVRGESGGTKGSRGGLLGISFLVGSAVELTSVGAGSMLMPYLMRIMDSPKKMVGTDLAFGFTISLLGCLFHMSIGGVNPVVAGALLVGSIPGTFVGVRLNNRISRRPLRFLLSVMILIAGVSVLMKSGS